VLKRSLANLVKHNAGELTALAKTRLRRMQYRPGLLEGFLAGTRLNLIPFCTPRIEDRVRPLACHRGAGRSVKVADAGQRACAGCMRSASCGAAAVFAAAPVARFGSGN